MRPGGLAMLCLIMLLPTRRWPGSWDGGGRRITYGDDTDDDQFTYILRTGCTGDAALPRLSREQWKPSEHPRTAEEGWLGWSFLPCHVLRSACCLGRLFGRYLLVASLGTGHTSAPARSGVLCVAQQPGGPIAKIRHPPTPPTDPTTLRYEVDGITRHLHAQKGLLANGLGGLLLFSQY